MGLHLGWRTCKISALLRMGHTMTLYKVDVTCTFVVKANSSVNALSVQEIRDFTKILKTNGHTPAIVTSVPLEQPKMPNQAAIIEEERKSFKPARGPKSWEISVPDHLLGRARRFVEKLNLTESDNA